MDFCSDFIVSYLSLLFFLLFLLILSPGFNHNYPDNRDKKLKLSIN